VVQSKGIHVFIAHVQEKRTVMFCGDETIREQKSGKFSFLQSSYQRAFTQAWVRLRSQWISLPLTHAM
jgi:hypothetical protein